MKTLEDRREELETRKAELLHRAEEVEEALESHASPDWEEQATEREGDEVLERMGLNAQAEIAKIDAALARMEAGEFGFCVTCGEKISEERLDVVPFTPFCRRCAPGRA